MQAKLEEDHHAARNVPWHRKRAEQKRRARERKAARKDKIRQKRQDRIKRGLPVLLFPTVSDINERKNARRALSDKLKGRTKRGVLEQVIGSGGLHAFKEKTLTSRAGQAIATDYDWSWRQKKFRPEERVTDRIDRMVGRMVARDDEQLQEQLKRDRKAHVRTQKKAMWRWQKDGDGGSATIVGSSATTGSGPGAPAISDIMKALGGSSGDRSHFDGRITIKRINSAFDLANPSPFALAADVAPFIDENDDPAGLLRGLSSHFDEEVDTEKVVECIEAETMDYLDDMKVDKDESKLSNTEFSGSATSEECQEYFTDDSNLNSNDEKYEKFDEQVDAELDDIFSVEWLNKTLQEIAVEIFADAKARFIIKEGNAVSDEDLELLYNQVTANIKQEWAIRMFLEGDKVSKKPIPISLKPFRKEFGPSFDEALLVVIGQPSLFSRKSSFSTGGSGRGRGFRGRGSRGGRGRRGRGRGRGARTAPPLPSPPPPPAPSSNPRGFRPGVTIPGRLEIWDDNDDDAPYSFSSSDLSSDHGRGTENTTPCTQSESDEADSYSDSNYSVNIEPGGSQSIESSRDNDQSVPNNSGAVLLSKRSAEKLIQEARQDAIKTLLGELTDGVVASDREKGLRRRLGSNWAQRFFEAAIEAIQLQPNPVPVQGEQSPQPDRPHGSPSGSNKSGRSFVSQTPKIRQTHPQAWPTLYPDQDRYLINQMNEELTKDTCGIVSEADERERDFAWDRHCLYANGKMQQPQLMDFDRKHDFRDYNDDILHEQITQDAPDWDPMSIDPQDTHIISRTWPVQYDGEAGYFTRVPVEIDGRNDAYDGTKIPIPTPPSDPPINGDGGGGPRPPQTFLSGLHGYNEYGDRGNIPISTIQVQDFGTPVKQPCPKPTPLNLSSKIDLQSNKSLTAKQRAEQAATEARRLKAETAAKEAEASLAKLASEEEEKEKTAKVAARKDQEQMDEINRSREIEAHKRAGEMERTCTRPEGVVPEPPMGHDHILHDLRDFGTILSGLTGPLVPQPHNGNGQSSEPVQTSSPKTPPRRTPALSAGVTSPKPSKSGTVNPTEIAATSPQAPIFGNPTPDDRSNKSTGDSSTNRTGGKGSVSEGEVENFPFAQEETPKRKGNSRPQSPVLNWVERGKQLGQQVGPPSSAFGKQATGSSFGEPLKSIKDLQINVDHRKDLWGTPKANLPAKNPELESQGSSKRGKKATLANPPSKLETYIPSSPKRTRNSFEAPSADSWSYTASGQSTNSNGKRPSSTSTISPKSPSKARLSPEPAENHAISKLTYPVQTSDASKAVLPEKEESYRVSNLPERLEDDSPTRVFFTAGKATRDPEDEYHAREHAWNTHRPHLPKWKYFQGTSGASEPAYVFEERYRRITTQYLKNGVPDQIEHEEEADFEFRKQAWEQINDGEDVKDIREKLRGLTRTELTNWLKRMLMTIDFLKGVDLAKIDKGIKAMTDGLPRLEWEVDYGVSALTSKETDILVDRGRDFTSRFNERRQHTADDEGPYSTFSKTKLHLYSLLRRLDVLNDKVQQSEVAAQSAEKRSRRTGLSQSVLDNVERAVNSVNGRRPPTPSQPSTRRTPKTMSFDDSMGHEHGRAQD
ncbi:hypothetical protein BKA67DRAFT_657278 [Truncatella angustata]|uniref:Uncharacterized protein n=1 Tax=Truncatella angustata TaxID=152316 RepID=A0A9P8UNQ2_9PEZI|nr:uncharacterized protein BKA67DRAFT_657278 [Truncatella angustata]KAH6655331.1 hypothetical protein BKA67DRAFT_657278 [Truncatella angustata]